MQPSCCFTQKGEVTSYSSGMVNQHESVVAPVCSGIGNARCAEAAILVFVCSGARQCASSSSCGTMIREMCHGSIVCMNTGSS